jgi:steroid 5-alpha reductase family enzyme
MGLDSGAFFRALGWPALAILAVLAVTYLASRIAGRHNVIDVAWGLLFLAATTVSVAVGSGDPGRRALLLAMVGIWSLRLAIHIGRRSIGKGEDPRYAEMLGDRGPVQTIAVVYGLQGVLAYVISMPIQLAAFQRSGLTISAVLGVALWLIGVLFEALGDSQMQRFKQAKSAGTIDRDAVMDRGLWRYTRHPNYFGDACVWLGIFLVCAERWPGVLTIFSPAIMVYLLAFGSGKKVLERSMARRPGYLDYMRRTSGFLPLPPR